jgi:hypothetical protein
VAKSVNHERRHLEEPRHQGAHVQNRLPRGQRRTRQVQKPRQRQGAQSRPGSLVQG